MAPAAFNGRIGLMRVHAEGQDIYSFQLFPPALCRRAVSRLRARRDWKPTSPGESLLKGSKLAIEDEPALLAAYERAVREVVSPVVLLSWCVPLAPRLSAGIVRYPPGGSMRVHHDMQRGRAEPRLISLVCTLNDGYEGGRTFFPRQGVRVEPAPGKAVLFPSGLTHPHAGEPVLAGVKYMLAGWF
jgi:hypothetical protein